MELGYVLLAADVVLGIALVALYRRVHAHPPEGPAASEDLAVLEAARRAALAAAEEAARERAELEAAMARAERLLRDWSDAPAPAGTSPAEARLAERLRALRRA
jgi:hypothetical protein